MYIFFLIAGEYDLFQMDDSYLTIFYDKHENNSVTAIASIEKSVEKNHETTFGAPSVELKKGFELQLFDLNKCCSSFSMVFPSLLMMRC